MVGTPRPPLRTENRVSLRTWEPMHDFFTGRVCASIHPQGFTVTIAVCTTRACVCVCDVMPVVVAFATGDANKKASGKKRGGKIPLPPPPPIRHHQNRTSYARTHARAHAACLHASQDPSSPKKSKVVVWSEPGEIQTTAPVWSRHSPSPRDNTKLFMHASFQPKSIFDRKKSLKKNHTFTLSLSLSVNKCRTKH